MKSRIPMTSREKNAMKQEIRRQALEFDKQHFNEYDSMILYTLLSEFNFGKKRLKRFYDAFHRNYEDLKEYYCMSDEDVPFICITKLRQIGVNLEEWGQESS